MRYRYGDNVNLFVNPFVKERELQNSERCEAFYSSYATNFYNQQLQAWNIVRAGVARRGRKARTTSAIDVVMQRGLIQQRRRIMEQMPPLSLFSRPW